MMFNALVALMVVRLVLSVKTTNYTKDAKGIMWEIINDNIAVPAVFVNEDGFNQNSRCNECGLFNRRLTYPDEVKTTVGTDGKIYKTPKVNFCWQHEPVVPKNVPKRDLLGIDWKVFREDTYVRLLVSGAKYKSERIRGGQQPVKMSRRTMKNFPIVRNIWVRFDLAESFIENPPAKLLGWVEIDCITYARPHGPV